MATVAINSVTINNTTFYNNAMITSVDLEGATWTNNSMHTALFLQVIKLTV